MPEKSETQNTQNNTPTIPEQGEYWADTINEISDALDIACTELEHHPRQLTEVAVTGTADIPVLVN